MSVNFAIMKHYFYLILFLALCSCNSPEWVRELEVQNPLKDSAGVVSVYFRFDTIINDFEVSGILYPEYLDQYGWNDAENGVRLIFRSILTGKQYVWTDWDSEYHCFKRIFMSKNVSDIVNNKKFKGFHNGDSYIFHYHVPDTFNTIDVEEPDTSILYSKAEYQFVDVDFDGDDELLIGYYHGGPYGCTCYEIYEMTDSTLVEKRPINSKNDYFSLDDNTRIDPENKRLINTYYSGCYAWGTYVYNADEKGNLYFLYEVHAEYDNENDIIISDTTFYHN